MDLQARVLRSAVRPGRSHGLAFLPGQAAFFKLLNSFWLPETIEALGRSGRIEPAACEEEEEEEEEEAARSARPRAGPGAGQSPAGAAPGAAFKQIYIYIYIFIFIYINCAERGASGGLPQPCRDPRLLQTAPSHLSSECWGEFRAGVFFWFSFFFFFLDASSLLILYTYIYINCVCVDI